MDGAAFREAVEEASATELDRLGSNKLLVALTGADLSRGAVLRAAADSEHAACGTFRAWAGDEADADARALFESVADQEADHRRRVLAALDEAYDPADGGPLHAYLRGREGTVERLAGGTVGRPLVSLRTHTQLVSFFVNEADETTADLFRELREETAAVLEDGLALLTDRCETDEEWTAARGVAEYTIQVAYDDYADALDELGVDPKPIC